MILKKNGLFFILAIIGTLYAFSVQPLILGGIGFLLLFVRSRTSLPRSRGLILSVVLFLVVFNAIQISPLFALFAGDRHIFVACSSILIFSGVFCIAIYRLIPKHQSHTTAVSLAVGCFTMVALLLFLTEGMTTRKKRIQLLRSPLAAPSVVFQGGASVYLNHHSNWALDLIPAAISGRIPYDYAHNYFGSFNADRFQRGDQTVLINSCYAMPVLLPIAEGVVRTLAMDYEDDPSRKSEFDDACGNSVVVDGEDSEGRFTLRFCHLKHQSVVVQAGQRLVLGQKLAECGHSGNSTTPHLHLEAFRTSEHNPVPFVLSELRGPVAQLRHRLFSYGLSPQRNDLIL